MRTSASTSWSLVLCQRLDRYTTATGPTGDRTVLQARTNTVTTAGAPNGSTTAFTYSSQGFLTQARETTTTGAVSAQWGYAYDKSGNRTRVLRAGGSQAGDEGGPFG